MTRILVVDDDPVQLTLAAGVAERSGFAVLLATSGRQALEMLRADPGIGCLVLDLVMPDLDGMAVLETMGREGLRTPVIVQTAHPEFETVVSALNRGATDFFVKPVAPERLVVSLRNAVRIGALETAIATVERSRIARPTLADIVTGNDGVRRAKDLAARAARNAIPVIEGEAGTGKTLFARIIHGASERAGRPPVLLQGATAEPASIASAIAAADGGTLLLEEPGELSPAAQAALADILAAGEIRAGNSRPRRLDLRIISATARRLVNLVRAGGFRDDLYYRLAVFPIYLPPLRDCRDDLEELAQSILPRLGAESGKRIDGLGPEALALLRKYDWPGNVRELETSLYRALTLCEGTTLAAADFPRVLAAVSGRAAAAKLTASLSTASGPVHIDAVTPKPTPGRAGRNFGDDRFVAADGEVAELTRVERDLIAFALARYAGRMSKVARALGIGRSTLYRKLKEYGLDDDQKRTAA